LAILRVLLLLQRCGWPVAVVDDAQDFFFTHDEVLVAFELDLLAGILAEQDVVAGFHVERDALALGVELAITRGDDFAPLRLFLRRVGNDDPADALFASSMR
jgi:hypothetical protein